MFQQEGPALEVSQASIRVGWPGGLAQQWYRRDFEVSVVNLSLPHLCESTALNEYSHKHLRQWGKDIRHALSLSLFGI